MCGITGYYSPDATFRQEELQKMSHSLVHRGPDAEGSFFQNGFALGHRRLSVIDLSEQANHPMISSTGRYVIILNGEIYNYTEVASELGLLCRTHSDTEVALEAFSKLGVGFTEKMNGMFAIAIFDTVEEKLFIFRDRVGIKPLYYYWDGKNFAFASEIKALRQLSHISQNAKINPDAISLYLYLGYIPQPLSIYSNIHKFPSGSYAIFDKQHLEIKPFWDPKTKFQNSVLSDEATAKEQLHSLLKQSVKYRLVSDVPYGTFLSGGVDSSLITAMAASVSDQTVKTFSIGFCEDKYNEANHARNVASHLGTNHHEFIVSYEDAKDLLPDILTCYDEPFADSSAIPTMLVSKLARQHVTMTLSGDGGDELFHGYGAYVWAERLELPLVKLFRKPAEAGLSMLSQRMKRASKILGYPSNELKYSHIFSQEQYLFSLSEIEELLEPDYYRSVHIDENFDCPVRKLTPAESQSFFDFNYYLKDDLLVKVDRATMKYSLETRVPMLDYPVVEFALNLSPDLKIKNNVSKYLLKQVLYDYVPQHLFDRPKKGFSIPLCSWLQGELSCLIDTWLSENSIRKHRLVRAEKVQQLIRRFRKGDEYLYNRIWLLIVLHQWMELR